MSVFSIVLAVMFYFNLALGADKNKNDGKVEETEQTSDNTVEKPCKTVVNVADGYVGGYGRSGRGGTRGSGYGASGGYGRGVTIATPYGGVRLGAHRECTPPPPVVVVQAPTAKPAESATPKPDVEELKKKIAANDAVIAELKALLAESESENEALTKRLAELEKQKTELEAKVLEFRTMESDP